MNCTGFYPDIKKVANAVKIVDTHEHLVPEEERVNSDLDALATFLLHYTSSDLVSSGIPLQDLDDVSNPRLPLKERWAKFAPFWERIQNTGYARALNIAVKDFYGLDGLKQDTYMKLTKRMNRRTRRDCISGC